MFKYLKFSLLVLLLIPVFIYCTTKTSNDQIDIIIKTDNGHAIEDGCSGFNVRIADKVWSYNHPDFRKAVHGLNPGWLRYFSGTMGDAFNSATGLYDKDYSMMFDHQQQYFKGYEFTQVKGPHRLIDLYELLGEVGGKLVVTINGFTETPQVAHELARFCKNNNIQVEVWQFCNEPYFYVPHRDRYWWNDGYDYAAKMKPYADAIKQVFPDAKLALNFTWDGIWGFMKEIHKYQQEQGAYWDVFSKHSYAPHVGGSEPFEKALKRANSKVIEATSPKAMDAIEDYSWEGVPMLITEFGVWNRPLNGIISAIYNVEYTLRQLEHTNTLYIGSHEVSNKFMPAKNFNAEIRNAYKNGENLNTDSLITGIVQDDEGKAIAMLHQATSHSNFTWHAEVKNNPQVLGLKNTQVDAIYARGFKGTNGYNYLLVTNRSESTQSFRLLIDDQKLNAEITHSFMSSKQAQNKDIQVITEKIEANRLKIPPYSVNLYVWANENTEIPGAPRIYKTKNTQQGIQLTWWKRELANGYNVYYGSDSNQLSTMVNIEGNENNAITIDNPSAESLLYFAVTAYNETGESKLSSTVRIQYVLPQTPQIFKMARRDTTITLMWESVPNASGYTVYVNDGISVKSYDANNTFGYRIEGLKYNISYNVSVAAYNGLGHGQKSKSHTITCHKNLPFPPRNVSAHENKDGSVSLKWVTQDTIHNNVKYRIYSGTQLHQYEMLAEGINGNTYVDKPSSLNFYYTVKSYTPEGECDFYPNTATVIKRNDQVLIEIENIEYKVDSVKINVLFNNIRVDGDAHYGVSVSDISYLNVEESIYKTDEASNGQFRITIPKSDFTKGRTYAVKAFVNTNGKSIYSLPPYSNIQIDKNE